jgi:hypothetical protein
LKITKNHLLAIASRLSCLPSLDKVFTDSRPARLCGSPQCKLSAALPLVDPDLFGVVSAKIEPFSLAIPHGQLALFGAYPHDKGFSFG